MRKTCVGVVDSLGVGCVKKMVFFTDLLFYKITIVVKLGGFTSFLQNFSLSFSQLFKGIFNLFSNCFSPLSPTITNTTSSNLSLIFIS